MTSHDIRVIDKLQSEVDRLRASNAELLAACFDGARTLDILAAPSHRRPDLNCGCVACTAIHRMKAALKHATEAPT